MKPKIAIFVEDRVFRVDSSRIASTNRRLAGTRWTALGSSSGEPILCARVGSESPIDAEHLVEGDYRALPYFQGLVKGMVSFPRLIWQCVAIAREVDLVVAKCPGLIGTAAVIGARLGRTPVAVHCVGDVEDVIADTDKGRRARALQRAAGAITRWAVRQAAAVRYPTMKFLQSKYPARSPRRQFWFTDAAVTALPAVPEYDGRVPGRIVAVGTQERMYKGHHLLIASMPRILERVPDAELILVGDGVMQPTLIAQAEDLGVRERVKFVGHVSGWDSMSAMMSSADVFAMPSLTEGLPRALLEAMSLGVACVGSAVSGIPELLPPSLLVPANDVPALTRKILELLEAPVRREEAAAECLERSRPFTQEALVPNIQAWDAKLESLARGNENE